MKNLVKVSFEEHSKNASGPEIGVDTSGVSQEEAGTDENQKAERSVFLSSWICFSKCGLWTNCIRSARKAQVQKYLPHIAF